MNSISQPEYSNVAVAGSTCATRQSQFGTNVGPHFNAAYTHNVAMLLCGPNDALSGGTPSTIYASMLQWIVKCNAAGFTCLLGTWIDSDYLSEGNRATLNASITGGAVANNYTVVDFGADATLGCNGCDSNATYFTDAPNIHPTAAADVIMAGILKTVLLGIGL